MNPEKNLDMCRTIKAAFFHTNYINSPENRVIMNVHSLLLLFLILIISSTVAADSTSVPLRILVGEKSLHARLDFFDLDKPGNQALSIILVDSLDKPVENATINITIRSPLGNRTSFILSPTRTGNYSMNHSFENLGYYNISVSITHTEFPGISGYKTVYVGLVEFSEFLNDHNAYQGTTAFFRLTARNIGNASSRIIPAINIFDSSRTLIFSRQGTSTTIEGNKTLALLQYNTLIFSVSSTPVGDYTVSAYIIFTDENNNTLTTPNRTSALKILATPTATTLTGTGTIAPVGATSVIVTRIIDESQAPDIPPPTIEFLQFASMPMLVEMNPGEQRTESIVVHNPEDQPITNVRTAIEGIPPEWFSIADGSFSIGAGNDHVVIVSLNIPQNIIPGNYQLKIRFDNGRFIRDFFTIVRINALQTASQADVFISKTVEVKEIEKQTNLVIKVRNKEKPVESLSIVEKIDKKIASHVDEIVFSQQPSRIIQPDPVVEFTFFSLKPFEERNITYNVKKIINTTSPFVFTSIEQTTSTIKPTAAVTETVKEIPMLLVGAATIGAIAVIVLVREIRKKRRIRKDLEEAKKVVVRVRVEP